MKKILGISLVAMMAVTTARADIASKAYVTVDQSANKEYNVITKEATPGVQIAELDAALGDDYSAENTVADAIANAVSTGTEKGVTRPNTTDAVGSATQPVFISASGVATTTNALGSAAWTDTTAYDAAGTAAAAVAALDATESQTAGADGLALSITETDGVITAISGSIAANTYDAHGAAATAESNAATYTDTKIGTLGNDAQSQPYTNVKAYVDDKVAGAAGNASAAIAALDATESQTAGADGLALSVTEVDGVITSISGSIAANTYDAYGAATSAVNGLSYTGATGGNVITQVTQTNGTISATMGKAAMEPASWTSDSDGEYALTATKSGDVITYHWELITRAN